MSSSFYRVSTANMYDATLRNLSARQKTLVDLQENLTAGKRVVRPSDDPVAAAQAERALTRISRIQTEQRALDVQRNAIAQAESTLGDAVGLVQEIRQLVVAAGGGAEGNRAGASNSSMIDSAIDALGKPVEGAACHAPGRIDPDTLAIDPDMSDHGVIGHEIVAHRQPGL